MPNFDHISDVNRSELCRLNKLYTFPEFVKQADVDAVTAPRSVAPNLYADPVRRQFPCDDKASTWLSALYFLDKQAEYAPKEQARVRERLEHYINYWQIKPAYDKLVVEHTAKHKTAQDQLPDSSFAWVHINSDGTKDRRLRLTNTVEVKTAAEYIYEHRERLPFDARNQMAKRIKEAQIQLGASLGDKTDFIEKQAGLGTCRPSDIVHMLKRRADQTKEAEYKSRYMGLAGSVAAQPGVTCSPTTMVKLAQTVEMLDRLAGLYDRYNDFIKPPEDVIFADTLTKAASDADRHITTVTGATYEKEVLSKLALSDLEALFGTEFSEKVRTGLEVDVQKMAEVIDTLPYPDARAVEGLLAEKNVLPLLHKRAGAKMGFNRAQLEELAKLY